MCLYVDGEKKYSLKNDEVFDLSIRTPLKASLQLQMLNQISDYPVSNYS